MDTKTLKIRAYNIEWDTDGDKEVFETLPKEVVMELAFSEGDHGYLDIIVGDKLSDEYGYCHNGFEYEIL